MIKVDITLHSARTGEIERLRSLHIVNDTTGSPIRGNYDVYLVNKNGKRYKQGRVENYARTSYPVQKLVKLALEALDV